MKVLNLRCDNGHGFEGWFASDDDYKRQNGSGLLECPLCGDKVITRMPTAPRLNLSGARAAEPAAAGASAAATSQAPPQPADLQAAWLRVARELVSRTEDVGPRFAEEARRMHYGEIEQRGIRGVATPEEREALGEEGIETFAFPLPRALGGPVQ